VVKAGDSLKESFPLSLFTEKKYVAAVHGPNGFFREFTGDENDPALEIACVYQSYTSKKQKLSGNIELHLTRIGGNKAYTVEIVDNSYMAKSIAKTIEPGSSKEVVILNLDKQHSWYDFSVKVAGFDDFEKRYAGHVETGQSSYTDSLMGGMLQKV
jgi:phospholipase C